VKKIAGLSRAKTTKLGAAIRKSLDLSFEDLDLSAALPQPGGGASRRGSTSIEGVRFAYFNRLNLSVKPYAGPAPPEAVRAIADAHRQFARDAAHEQQQFIAPLGDAGWVVAKKDGARLLFLHLDDRYATTADALACVERLRAGLLSNIRILEN